MMPLSDPTGAQSLLSAAQWVESTLLGSTAMVVATLAVATLGFLMLSGRVPFKRGAGVLLGCFVLFGATTLAQGIKRIAGVDGGDAPPLPVAIANPPPRSVIPPPAQPQVYDPYAGAAVPVR